MKKTLLLSSLMMFVVWSCEDATELTSTQRRNPSISVPKEISEGMRSRSGRVDVKLKDVLNSSLFAGKNFQISQVEIYSAVTSATSVETLDQQFESTLSSRWVTNDTRRNWNGDGNLKDIDWLSFTPLAVANGSINAEPVYEAMYNKWEKGGTCKTLDIDRTPYSASMGNPSLILGIGGPPAEMPLADVSLIGFLPPGIFEAVFGSPNVLGVAFSFVFINPDTGLPIKTTRGKEDKAFTEVWFNDGFAWSKGVAPGKIDIESVVLHEFGHTLNLGHFGILQAFTTDGQTKLVYQPVNTMNAYYIGEARNFLGPNDKGNYCEAWGSWPWN